MTGYHDGSHAHAHAHAHAQIPGWVQPGLSGTGGEPASRSDSLSTELAEALYIDDGPVLVSVSTRRRPPLYGRKGY